MIAEYRPDLADKKAEEIQAIVMVENPTCIGWSYSYYSKLLEIRFVEDMEEQGQ